MSGFTVPSVPGGPFGRAVLATFVEKGAAYQFALVPPGAAKSDPHVLRHPFGRVPVLEHDGFTLYETQAILRYLDRVLSGPALTPADPKDAARMDQVINVSDWYLFHGVNNVIGFHRIVGPRLLGLTPDETAVANAMPKAHLVLNELSRLLGSKSHFVGGEVTLADLHVASQLDFLANTPEWKPLAVYYPNLVSWLHRLNDRASFRATTWERLAELAKAA